MYILYYWQQNHDEVNFEIIGISEDKNLLENKKHELCEISKEFIVKRDDFLKKQIIHYDKIRNKLYNFLKNNKELIVSGKYHGKFKNQVKSIAKSISASDIIHCFCKGHKLTNVEKIELRKEGIYLEEDRPKIMEVEVHLRGAKAGNLAKEIFESLNSDKFGNEVYKNKVFGDIGCLEPIEVEFTEKMSRI